MNAQMPLELHIPPTMHQWQILGKIKRRNASLIKLKVAEKKERRSRTVKMD